MLGHKKNNKIDSFKSLLSLNNQKLVRMPERPPLKLDISWDNSLFPFVWWKCFTWLFVGEAELLRWLYLPF